MAEAGASADAVDCAGAELALLERADDWLGCSASLDKVAPRLVYVYIQVVPTSSRDWVIGPDIRKNILN